MHFLFLSYLPLFERGHLWLIIVKWDQIYPITLQGAFQTEIQKMKNWRLCLDIGIYYFKARICLLLTSVGWFLHNHYNDPKYQINSFLAHRLICQILGTTSTQHLKTNLTKSGFQFGIICFPFGSSLLAWLVRLSRSCRNPTNLQIHWGIQVKVCDYNY